MLDFAVDNLFITTDAHSGGFNVACLALEEEFLIQKFHSESQQTNWMEFS